VRVLGEIETREFMTFVLPTRRQAYATCVLAALALAGCAALIVAAALAHAPPLVLPLVAVVSIGCPFGVAWSLPTALAVLRHPRDELDRSSLKALRRTLDQLPETDHPLGL
jgi:fatty acid desaturase